MDNINDLQIGKAGEYLVCADLILNGHVAFPSEQGLPFDVVSEINGRLIKIQVKTTRKPKDIPQRKSPIPAYIFHIGNNGKGNRRKKYDIGSVDIFALVALDSKRISYLPYFNTQTTMNFRVPELKGKYHDEIAVPRKKTIASMRESGLSCKEISEKLKIKLSNVYKYTSNTSIEQVGTNSGVYFNEFTLDKCLNTLKI